MAREILKLPDNLTPRSDTNLIKTNLEMPENTVISARTDTLALCPSFAPPDAAQYDTDRMEWLHINRSVNDLQSFFEEVILATKTNLNHSFIGEMPDVFYTIADSGFQLTSHSQERLLDDANNIDQFCSSIQASTARAGQLADRKEDTQIAVCFADELFPVYILLEKIDPTWECSIGVGTFEQETEQVVDFLEEIGQQPIQSSFHDFHSLTFTSDIIIRDFTRLSDGVHIDFQNPAFLAETELMSAAESEDISENPTIRNLIHILADQSRLMGQVDGGALAGDRAYKLSGIRITTTPFSTVGLISPDLRISETE